MSFFRCFVLLWVALYLHTSNAFGQGCYEKIKATAIKADISKPHNFESQQPFVKDLYCLVQDGILDSIDIDILLDNDFFSTNYINLIRGIKPNEKKITYRNLVTFYTEIKEDVEYPLFVLVYRLEKIPATYENHTLLEEEFRKANYFWFDEEYVAPIVKYLEAHSNDSLNMLNIWDNYNEETYLIQDQIDQLLKPKMIDENFLISESKKENKAILLYFTAYSSGSSRKLEDQTLYNQNLLNYIDSNFVMATLYVDDQRALKDNATIYYEQLNKTASTIGEVNLFYQMERFEIASSPYFVVMNHQAETLGIGTYEDLKTCEDFRTFLVEIIESQQD